MAAPDVIGGGPALDPGTPLDEQVRQAAGRIRRLRQAGAVVSVAALAAAGVLASRATPEPSAAARSLTPPPALTPAPGVTGGPTVPTTVPTRRPRGAVGGERVYALVVPCASQPAGAGCGYRLLRRSVGGGGWTAGRLPVLPAPAVGGLPPWVFVSGEDTLTVVDRAVPGRVLVSTDGGDRFTARPARAGPPVAAVPADAVLDPRLCTACRSRLTVLEPATGRYRRLATPPPLADEDIRSFAMRGDVIWVVGDEEGELVTAVSPDRGRSWRVVPVPRARPPAQRLRVVPTRDGGAYLVVSLNELADVWNEFSELWRVTRSGAEWTELHPPAGGRPRSAGAVVSGERGLLVAEETGGLWRLLPSGAMVRLPDPVVDGGVVRPGWLATGPGGMMLGWPVGAVAPVPLVSYDEGETWRAEPLPS